MGQRFSRRLGSVSGLEPGQYTTSIEPYLVGRAIVCCPQCGGLDAIGDEHAIDGAGRVVPAWTCPTATCSYQAFLELETHP